VHKLVYLSDSPGGGNAGILRYDASHDVYTAFPEGSITPDAFGVVHCETLVANPCTVGSTAGLYIRNGILPGAVGQNVVIGTGNPGSHVNGVRPWDFANRPTLTTGFAFVFGLSVGPNGELAITEDPSAGARSGRGTMWTVALVN